MRAKQPETLLGAIELGISDFDEVNLLKLNGRTKKLLAMLIRSRISDFTNATGLKLCLEGEGVSVDDVERLIHRLTKE